MTDTCFEAENQSVHKQQQLVENIIVLIRLVQQNPTNAEYRRDLGFYLCEDGNFEHALYHLFTATMFADNRHELNADIAKILVKSGNPIEALKWSRHGPNLSLEHTNLNLQSSIKVVETVPENVDTFTYYESKGNQSLKIPKTVKEYASALVFEQLLNESDRLEGILTTCSNVETVLVNNSLSSQEGYSLHTDIIEKFAFVAADSNVSNCEKIIRLIEPNYTPKTYSLWVRNYD